MRETQTHYHPSERINNMRQAVEYWRTLSDSQQQTIYDQAGW